MSLYARDVAFRRRRETVISVSGGPVKDNRQKEDILLHTRKTPAVGMKTNWKQGISLSITSYRVNGPTKHCISGKGAGFPSSLVKTNQSRAPHSRMVI
jgi:hypothetical protein